jgi:hypothetical protein
MRAAPLLPLALAVCPADAIAAEPPYAFWDNQEPMAAYARRVGMELTKTLDLGDVGF